MYHLDNPASQPGPNDDADDADGDDGADDADEEVIQLMNTDFIDWLRGLTCGSQKHAPLFITMINDHHPEPSIIIIIVIG